MTGEQYSEHYQAAADTDVVVSDKGGFLVGIIIGEDQSSAVIEISDHASDGDGNVVVYLAGDNLSTKFAGYIPIGFRFATGICCDIAAQTHLTFVFR